MPLGANKVALFGSSGVVTDTSVLLATGVASASASLEFTIPTTYKEIVFGFYNIAPATDSAEFMFQVDESGQSNFNKTITSTSFRAYNHESYAISILNYSAGDDQAQGTAYQHLAHDVDNDADSCVAGELHLYNPSSTTYVKHFMARVPFSYDAGWIFDNHIAGYINETVAIGEISFKFHSGNIASGTIKMWGVR